MHAAMRSLPSVSLLRASQSIWARMLKQSFGRSSTLVWRTRTWVYDMLRWLRLVTFRMARGCCRRETQHAPAGSASPGSRTCHSQKACTALNSRSRFIPTAVADSSPIASSPYELFFFQLKTIKPWLIILTYNNVADIRRHARKYWPLVPPPKAWSWKEEGLNTINTVYCEAQATVNRQICTY